MPKVMEVPVPDGTYAVADPDNPDVMTLWLVVRGNLKAWPLGHRWAPFPPKAPQELQAAERRQWRDQWYERVYFAWKDAVVDAIAADPAAAAAEFDRRVPEGERPTPEDLSPPKRRRPPRRRTPSPTRSTGVKARFRDLEARQAMLAATLAGMGNTVERVALALDVPETTAWRRIQKGKELLGDLQSWMPRAMPTDFLASAASRLEEAERDGL